MRPLPTPPGDPGKHAATHCQLEGCDRPTNFGKPYCTQHVLEIPQAADLRAWAELWDAPIPEGRACLDHPKACAVVEALVDQATVSPESPWVGFARLAGLGITKRELRRLVGLLEVQRRLVTRRLTRRREEAAVTEAFTEAELAELEEEQAA